MTTAELSGGAITFGVAAKGSSSGLMRWTSLRLLGVAAYGSREALRDVVPFVVDELSLDLSGDPQFG